MSRYRLWFVGLLVWLLVSCVSADLEQTVTFYRGGGWNMQIDVIMPTDEILFASTLDEVDAEMQGFVDEELKIDGVDVTWKRADAGENTVYTIDISGSELATFNATMDGGGFAEQIEIDGKTHLRFEIDTEGDFENHTYSVIGNEIISGNGIEEQAGMMQWINPVGRLEVVLVEKRNIPTNALLAAAIVLVLTALGWFGWRRGLRLPRLRQAKACQYCKTAMDDESLFCSNCGRQQVESLLNCHNCGEVVDTDATFCGNCGTSTTQNAEAQRCAKCDVKLEADAEFCMECGHRTQEK